MKCVARLASPEQSGERQELGLLQGETPEGEPGTVIAGEGGAAVRKGLIPFSPEGPRIEFMFLFLFFCVVPLRLHPKIVFFVWFP